MVDSAYDMIVITSWVDMVDTAEDMVVMTAWEAMVDMAEVMVDMFFYGSFSKLGANFGGAGLGGYG
ncbi:hypothetical protein ACJMK2_005811, partial [Sinanodonta woodiana]